MKTRLLFLFGVPKGSYVYIAGPMTAFKDQCYNFERFFYWAAILRASGYIPINPAEMDCERMLAGEVYDPAQYREILDNDLKEIRDKAAAIFNLEDWEQSPGAIEENEEAQEKGIPYFNEVDYK
jgi:nucleoside 2-deoxyribosyltransferase